MNLRKPPRERDAAAVQASGRIEGLDAWRAILMLGGLLVHAASWKEPNPFFGTILLVSNSFRMGSFFIISGLLCGLAVAHRPAGQWLRRRLVRIGVPTAFGLAVVCPLVSLVLYYLPATGQPAGARPAIDWYHLWFLVALLLYTLLTYPAELIDRRSGWLMRVADRFGRSGTVQLPAMLATSAVSFTLMVLAQGLVATYARDDLLAPLSQCLLIAGYVPAYLLGFLLAKSPAFRLAFAAARTLPLVILGAVGSLYIVWYGFVPESATADFRWWDGLIRLAGSSLCPPAAAVLILRSAMTMRRRPRFLRHLADASFTMYIVHFPIILLVNLGFGRVAWNPYLEYGIAVAVGGVLSFGFHRYCVARSDLLALLFNGCFPAPKPLRQPLPVAEASC